MTNLPTVTIGIPAYNEEANIGQLLADLANQNQSTFVLEKILVASDASTDQTDNIVQEFAKKYHGKLDIILIPNNKREGQGTRQNQIIEDASSDILVLLNADIAFDDQNFIVNLIDPITRGADMTCGPLAETKPTTMIERILSVGSVYRRTVFAKYNNGNNVFTCHGSHRALSKRMYTHFRFQGSVAEDAYSYLYCLKNGFNYKYADNAVASVKLPSSLPEHLSQSKRFFRSGTKLSNYFDAGFINNNTKWPVSIFFTEGLKTFFNHPVDSVLYLCITIYTFALSKLSFANEPDTWNMVLTSKTVRS